MGKQIYINPYKPEQLNPNSYNLTLHPKLLVYEEKELDMKQQNKVKEIIIPESGYILNPGQLYLGRTTEKTRTDHFVPFLEGRSSVARLGITVHLTAGLGNVGANGHWTLEISCVQPVRIYPNVEICQIYFQEIKGDFVTYRNGKGKYHNEDVQPSLMYMEFL